MMRYFRLMLPSILVMAQKPLVGGQAVMEGVMMRSPKSFAVAVRKKDGTIVVRETPWLSFTARFTFLRWPLLRGASMLIESMYNGMSALQFSAEQAMDDEEKKDADSKAKAKKSSKGLDWALVGTMIFSMLFGIAIFKGVPHMLAYGIGEWYGTGGESALPMTSVWFHLVDGVIKMSLFVGYILAISLMEDVRRLFMYHGAEHKAVHAFEKDLPLDVKNTRIQPTAHPRCGTSLILLVLSVSIVVFAILLPLMPVVSDSTLWQSLFSLAIKVPLMLPIAGVAYEFQRAAAKNPGNLLVKAFISPGMLMQRLTTKEPTDDQLEVSLAALLKTRWREKQENTVLSEKAETEAFESFDAFVRKMDVA